MHYLINLRIMEIGEQILIKLEEIESKYDIRILLAVESGSRAWGFASSDSDYDVRFIYVHKLNWYLSLQKERDVIEELDPNGVMDISGWDLKKALTMMGKGNCSFIEWLESPIVYCCDKTFVDKINGIKNLYFRNISVVNHYYHMAMNHDRRYLNKRGWELKRFMYHIRGLLAASWAMEKGTYPPVPFCELVKAMVDDTTIQNELRELVRLKSQSKEYDNCIVNEKLVQYARGIAQDISDGISRLQYDKPTDMNYLNNLFISEIIEK